MDCMNFYVIVKLYSFRHLRVLLFSTLIHIYTYHICRRYECTIGPSGEQRCPRGLRR